MGVIKEGTVSGFLPEKEGFAVHYPGYPSSISRAVETLGGTEGILKACSSESNSLELRFRPEDPYSHPAFGKLRPCCNLLLKISKKRTNDQHPAVVSVHMLKPSTVEMADLETVTFGPETVQQRNGPESAASLVNEGNHQQIQEAAVPANLFADIVARVPKAYHFDGMVDYQHVPVVHADVLETVDLMDTDQEESILLVPPLFSPKDVPEKLVLRPPSALSSKSKQEAVVEQRWEMNIEPCLAIDYGIEDSERCRLFPEKLGSIDQPVFISAALENIVAEIPKKINWEENVERGSAEYKGLMAVSKLFDERPIWPRRSLKERLVDENLPFGEHLFKRLLFRTAYYFSTGPFQRFWIRKGYDPRKDPDSRIYQRIDFRVPPSLRNHGAADPTDGLHTWRNLCAFLVFPWKCQTSFQLFELDDDYIQQEIRKPLERPAFTYSAGWFSSYVLESLRLRIAVRFLSICPKVGAKDLHKFACARFEKSKRAHGLKRDASPDEEEHQHVNKDSSCQASGATILVNYDETDLVCDDGKDEAGDQDDNDADDEIEGEEDEEEEFDEYESLHLDGDDGDFSLQPSYPIGENISKNYLQELFGGFPSTELGNNKMQYAESSDGEYQIFEDDSGNDNYSDDE